jgi:Zn-dependent protease
MFLQNQYLMSIGSIKNVPIKLHATYLILLSFSILNALPHGLQPMIESVLVYGPLLLITILMHELGHSFMSLRLGCDVECIILWPLGGLSMCAATATASDSLKVSLAGPLTHIPMFLFWKLVLYMVLSDSMHFITEFEFIYYWLALLAMNGITMNAFLFAFNLIPAYPLDGGQILASLLSMRNVETNRAGKLTSICSFIVAAFMLGEAVNSIVFQHTNPNAYLICMMALYIFKAGFDLYTLADEGNAVQHPLFSHRPRYFPFPATTV